MMGNAQRQNLLLEPLISNKKGKEHVVHEDPIKPHVKDVFAGKPRELCFWRGGRNENRVNTGEKEV